MKSNLKWNQWIPAAALGVALAFGAWGCTGEKSTENVPPTSTTASTESGANSPAKTRPAPTATGNTTTGDKIKLGIVASLTGDQKPWGDDSIAGAQLAVEEVNAAGGINGKMVELVQGDSNSNPEQGKTAAEKLISDGVVAMIGEVASGITIQMAKACFEKGIPLVAIGATKDEVTDEGSNIFRVCYIDSFQGPVMAEFAYNELGLRNIAIMTDKKLPYSTGLSNNFRKHFEKLGGTIVAEEFYESKQPDFKAQLTNIKAKNPDGLFLSGYFTEVGPIARQTKDVGLTVKVLGGDGWDSKEIINSGGEGIIGGYFCNHYSDSDTRAQVQDFLTKWKAKHSGQTPGTTMGALGYDAAWLVMDAMKRAAKPDSKDIMDALENTENLECVSGTITLKGMGGNPPKRALVVSVTKDGFSFAKAYEPKDITK